MKAEDFKAGGSAQYLGGDPDLDAKGFVQGMRYDIICQDPFGVVPNRVIVTYTDFVTVVDDNGNLTGKACYFNVDPVSMYDFTWRKGIAVKETNTSCLHEWKEYIGFNDTFTYCSKCDIKKPEGV